MVRIPLAQFSARLCCKAARNSPSLGGNWANKTCQIASIVWELSDNNGADSAGALATPLEAGGVGRDATVESVPEELAASETAETTVVWGFATGG